MSSTHERSSNSQARTYDRASSIVFLKTNEPFGGLSNMAGGFPLHVQGARIYTSEALYQACRFPQLPDLQRLVIRQTSPMTAKMKSKPHCKDSRPDWDRVRVKVMRWCLRVKLAQNWAKFGELLLRTGNRPIVEESRRDNFWGAKPADEQTLVGVNVLGRLLMELRELMKTQGRDAFRTVEPPGISEFLLFGRPIGAICESGVAAEDSAAAPVETPGRRPGQDRAAQASLFDASSARPVPAPDYLGKTAPRRDPLGDLKPYPAVRDSGVTWLGLVPAHWQVLPNRAVFTEVKERDRPHAEMLSVTITNGVIRQQELLADSSKKDSSKLDRSAYKLVRPGDIVYNKMRAWQGAVGVSEYEGIVSPAYVVQRPRQGAAPRYLHHLLRTPAFAKEAGRWSYGITSDMWSLRPEHFKMIYSCLPPLPEQAAIVRFLDHADRRIRRFIRAKQKLIRLLEEQKQAIVHLAVTRGLDPNVRLTPSGVQWLGDVPEHWEVVRFKRRVGFQEGPGIMAADFRMAGVPLLRISCLRGQTASLDGCNFLDPSMVRHRWSHFAVRTGEYLLSASASTGNVVLATEVIAGAIPYTGILRLWPLSDAAYMPFVRLYMGARPFQEQIDAAKTGVGIEHFGPTHLKRMCITLPPATEQVQIVEAVASQVAPFAVAVERASREIALLREYRTRLIADVVTGKLDVREAAARLPDEAEAPEFLDEVEAEGEAQDSGDDDSAEPLEEAEA